ENQDGVAFGRLVHPELKKLLLRAGQRVLFEFSPLQKNADLPRRFRFGRLDRFCDPIVLELPEKIVRPHVIYQLDPAPPPPKLPPPPLNPLKPPPPSPPLSEDQPPPLGIKIGPPPRDE